MKYIYIEGENHPTASHVNLRESKLEFSCDRGKSCLVVQSEYGKDLDIRALVEILEQSQRNIQEFTQLTFPTVECRYQVQFVNPQMIALIGGVDIIERACRYTIIVVDIEDKNFQIYQPNSKAFYPYYVDVKYEIALQIVKHSEIEVYKEKGWFKKKIQIEKIYYEMIFQEDYSKLFTEGAIYYHIGNCRNIPISKEVLSYRNFYIKSKIKPEIETQNQGLYLNIRG